MRMSGGTEKRTPQAECTPRRTWLDIINGVREPRKKKQDMPPNSGGNPDDD